jgi:hypothetical protein
MGLVFDDGGDWVGHMRFLFREGLRRRGAGGDGSGLEPGGEGVLGDQHASAAWQSRLNNGGAAAFADQATHESLAYVRDVGRLSHQEHFFHSSGSEQRKSRGPEKGRSLGNSIPQLAI